MCSGRLVMASTTAVYRQVNEARWEFELWAGEEDTRGWAEGNGVHARFHSIAAVGDDGHGGAVLVDAQREGTYGVRHIDPSGGVRTLFTTIHDDSGDDGLGSDSDASDKVEDPQGKYGWRFPGGAYSDDASSASGDSATRYDSDLRAGVASSDDIASSAFRVSGALRSPLMLPDGTLLLCAPQHDGGSLLLVRTIGVAPKPLAGLPAVAQGRGGGAAGSFPTAPAGPPPLSSSSGGASTDVVTWPPAEPEGVASCCGSTVGEAEDGVGFEDDGANSLPGELWAAATAEASEAACSSSGRRSSTRADDAMESDVECTSRRLERGLGLADGGAGCNSSGGDSRHVCGSRVCGKRRAASAELLQAAGHGKCNRAC